MIWHLTWLINWSYKSEIVKKSGSILQIRTMQPNVDQNQFFSKPLYPGYDVSDYQLLPLALRKYFLLGDFLMYNIQHCFICRLSDSTVLEDARIEPRTVQLRHRRSNHSVRSYPQKSARSYPQNSARSHPHTAVDETEKILYVKRIVDSVRFMDVTHFWNEWERYLDFALCNNLSRLYTMNTQLWTITVIVRCIRRVGCKRICASTTELKVS